MNRSPRTEKTSAHSAGRFFGRGGEKLQAAFDHFGLTLHGAKAIDIGASTGGFTHCMLLAGASSVCAVDVGTGQLHTELRKDARVESHERTDFKTLTLKRLPGPYDFFTIDVSFVAARSMLRGLAFRLRPGSQGVVLVKPQFELAERFVKRGGYVDSAHQEAAIEQLRKKGERLGFTVIDWICCPVEIASGTVELLAHLRFEGRTAHLPRGPTDEANYETIASASTAKAQSIYEMFAVASPGFEVIVEKEVAALPGVASVAMVPGGVEFSGDDEVLYRANLWLRTPTRVLVRLGTVSSGHFASFRRRAAKLPWSGFIPRKSKRPLRVESSVTHCRLYHTGALAENIALAAGGQVHGAQDDDEDVQRILLRGQDDHFQISVDASGALLHKRGWRLEAGVAPLRETHAAAMLALTGWTPEEPLLDPMCGAGTIAIEAASIACGLPPGLGRKFAFFAWPSFNEPLWMKLCDEAAKSARNEPEKSEERNAKVFIFSWDADEAAIERARRNAERAGVGHLIRFTVKDILRQGSRSITSEEEAFPPSLHKAGLVLCNPPYGKRMGSPLASRHLLRSLAMSLASNFSSWRTGLLLPDTMVRQGLPFACERTHPVSSGGLRLTLAEVASGGFTKERQNPPGRRSRRRPR